MPTKQDDQNDIERGYDSGHGAYKPGSLSESEQVSFDDIADNFDTSTADPTQENDNITKAREREHSPQRGGWNTNVTGAGKGKGGKIPLNRKQLIKQAMGQKGPLGAIIAIIILGGGAAGIFGSNTFLGQGLAAQLNTKFAQSLPMVNSLNDNILRIKLFGSKIRVDCSDPGVKIMCQFQGITSGEMKALERNGVKFFPADGIDKGGGLKSFDAIEVNGERVSAGEFNSKLRDPSFRRSIKPVHNPLWKSMKNGARKLVRATFRVSTDADTRATSPEELKKKVFDSVDSDTGDPRASVREGATDPDNQDPNQDTTQVDQGTTNGVSELNETIDELKEAARNGDDITKLPTETSGALLHEGIQVGDSALKRIWSFVNTLDIADVICTSYQIANTATMLARTVAMVNAMRFAATFLSAWDKAKSGYVGNSEPEEIEQLMNTLTALNSSGQSFNSSATAQFVLHGKLTTANPLTSSSFGSEALRAISNGLYELHSSLGGGNALQGRTVLRNTCAILTNLLVQGIVTLGSIALTFITGGSGGAVIAALRQAGKQGLDIAMDFFKNTIIRSIRDLFSADDLVRLTARRDARRLIAQNLADPINIIALALVLVENFGMDWIAQTLAGTDILGALSDPVEVLDTIGAGDANEDYISAIANGAHPQTLDQAIAYDNQVKQSVAEYVQVERLAANPFDVHNPYSTMGSFMSQLSIPLASLSSSGSLLSSVKSALKMPMTSISSISTTVGAAGVDPTPENLSAYINDPYMVNSGLANDFYGNPLAGADLSYVKSQDLETVISESIDAGYINEAGEIIAGSAYETHVYECNNPLRTQVDPTVFEGDYLMPEHCIGDIDEQTKYFNYLTAVRSQLLKYYQAASPNTTANGSAEAGGTVAVSDGWSAPIQNPTKNWNNYGVARAGYAHNGVDYSAPLGTPIYAAHGGVVSTEYRRASSSTPATFYIVVTNPTTGVVTEYGHSYENQILVNSGAVVQAGQQITVVGNQGNSTGPHLHFGVVINGVRQNPTTILAQHGITIP